MWSLLTWTFYNLNNMSTTWDDYNLSNLHNLRHYNLLVICNLNHLKLFWIWQKITMVICRLLEATFEIGIPLQLYIVSQNIAYSLYSNMFTFHHLYIFFYKLMMYIVYTACLVLIICFDVKYVCCKFGSYSKFLFFLLPM